MSAAEEVRLMRLVATQVNAVFNCGTPTALGPCVFMAGHDGGHVGMLEPTPLCRICRGRGQIPGTTDMCWTCLGAGVEE